MNQDQEQAASEESSLQVAAIVVALLATVGGAWLFLNHRNDTTVIPHQVSVPGDTQRTLLEAGTDSRLPIDTAMQMAEMAFQAGHIAEPTDGSAVFFYRQVLSLDPANPRAVQGLRLIATQLTDEALEQIDKRNYEVAITRLELLDDIEPESDNVAAVRKSLVEKSRIMYAAMDKALQREELDKAEYYARRVAVFPDADDERVSAALQNIANARQELETGTIVADDDSPALEVVTSEYTSTQDVAFPPVPDNTAENPGSEIVALVATDTDRVAQGFPDNSVTSTVVSDPLANNEADNVVSDSMERAETDNMVSDPLVNTEADNVASDALLNTEPDNVGPDLQDMAGAETPLLAITSIDSSQPSTAGTLSVSGEALTTPQEIISPDTVSTLARRIENLLTTASQRVATGLLITPPDNSAVHYYREALSLDNSNSVAKRGMRSLVQTITADALRQAEAGDWDGAESLLEAAADIGYANNFLDQTRSHVKELRIAAEQNRIVNIDQFTVKKTVTPKYPRRAVSRSVEGWVTLEFVVSETGETRDIKVVESSSQYANQFARAAISAVEQWRFQPREFDGQAIAQRSKTTVQFKLTD